MTGAVWAWVDSLHRLAWSQRLTLTLLVLGGIFNLYVATCSWIEPLWKRSYIYKGAMCTITAAWYILLVTGVIAMDQFVQVTRWLQPCLVFALILSALQHLGERRLLERRAQLREQLTDQANRVVADEGSLSDRTHRETL